MLTNEEVCLSHPAAGISSNNCFTVSHTFSLSIPLRYLGARGITLLTLESGHGQGRTLTPEWSTSKFLDFVYIFFLAILQ